VPQIKYLGSYPTKRLADGKHGGFLLQVRVFFKTTATTNTMIKGKLSLDTQWGGTVNSTEITVSFTRLCFILFLLCLLGTVLLHSFLYLQKGTKPFIQI
jgi:hypothetical protein